ncbi:hypothetical protein OIU76_019286 [Salix suchowensis]|uniref:Metallothionein-like protein type 3 n=2 Tax=Salix TaxID=40685 RepID=A0A9Q0VUJ4_SALPP|nr:metallothionein protein [Salix suchowensis]KAJ6298119.1 hypothetical protein OIU76_019286 [Salix suchowensis]KAJ6301535.1 hypothetical protein OIU77_015778 [Salix suchowensis]KAJ6314232.1 hypothetical protein OIU78_017819 [Salix suchowensis]KAJ6753760.1 hypothetical protein OIU79_026574 [Salix purpurea]
MSSACDTCNCADKTQCDKKRSSYTADIVETEKSYVVMEVPAGENDGKCKCGTGCTCTTCTCGH